MKRFMAIGFLLSAVTASAQVTSFSQVQHVQTALNHLTVIDMGEPVTMLAVANPDAFQVERHEDKVFLKPLKEGASTNLFIWTANRQQSYELDPPGDLAKMNVLIRSSQQGTQQQSTSLQEPKEQQASDAEIQKIANLVLTQAMLGTEDLSRIGVKHHSGRVAVELEQVFRAKDKLYIRYSVANLTKHPFRLTTPDTYALSPSAQPISLYSLRDHQLPPRTAAAFRIKSKTNLPTLSAEAGLRDIAPGGKITGVVSIETKAGNAPQMYELNFGHDEKRPIAVQVVL